MAVSKGLIRIIDMVPERASTGFQSFRTISTPLVSGFYQGYIRDARGASRNFFPMPGNDPMDSLDRLEQYFLKEQVDFVRKAILLDMNASVPPDAC